MAKNKSQTNTTATYTPEQTAYQTNLQSNVIPSFMNQFNTTQKNQQNDYNSMMETYRNLINTPVYGMGRTGVSGGMNFGSPNASGGSYTPTATANPMDRNQVQDQIIQAMQSHGLTPSMTRGTGANDVQYYTDQAMNTGGGTQGNMGYWADRIGKDAGGGGSGGGMWSFGTAPAFPGFNSPAYQYFQQFAQNGGNVGFDPEAQGAISSALGHYGDFANTGGFSPQDLADMRARAISPTRSIYASAQQNLNRSRALQPYSPNYAAASAKMAREQSQQISDANVNANAAIAQAVQQGKEFGTSGLSSTGLSEGQIKAAIDQFNQGMKMQGAQGMAGLDQFAAQLQEAYDQLGFQYADMNARTGLGYDTLASNNVLNALSGERALYGTVPGETSMYNTDLMQLYGLDANSINNPANRSTTQPMTGLDYMQMIGSGINTGTQAYDAYKKFTGPSTTAPGMTDATTVPTASSLGITPAGNAAMAGFGAGSPMLSAAASPGLSAVPASTLGTLPAIPSAASVSGIPAVAAPTTAGSAASSSTAAGTGVGTGAAGTAVGSALANIAAPLAIMWGVNKYTGGPSEYNRTGFMGNYTPFGSQSGIQDTTTRQNAQNQANMMEAIYGPDDPQVVQFKMLNGLA